MLMSGTLPQQEEAEIENHLAVCAECRKYYDEMRMVVAPLTNWEKEFSHIEPTEAARNRWAKAIQVSGKPALLDKHGNAFYEWWRELILPYRHVWGGMAAVWLVMLGANFGLAGGTKTEMVAHAAPTAAMMEAMKEQRRLLVELIPPANIEPMERPRRGVQPRSEQQADWRTC
ncbi:MAG: hypothetical protein JWQ71_4389 [Pedosphaera sp.]|nr:hypothetical protein [Pedosphaera sp.]